jgi:hypothetical protein
MMMPFPVSFLFAFHINRKIKDDMANPSDIATGTPTQAISAPLDRSYDPVLLLMLVAIMLLSSAVLVYAARH